MKEQYADGIYSQEFAINADDVGVYNRLNLKKLMLFMQKIAVNHYTNKAQSWQELVKSKKSWVMTKLEIEINKLPRLSQSIDLRTWSKGTDRFKGYRNYSMLDASGTILFNAQSQFIFLDLQAKKPSIFSRDEFPNFVSIDKENFDYHVDSWRITPINSDQFDETYDYQLRFSDFDINRHLNNTTYFEILEDISEKLKLKLNNVKAVFKKEIKLGINIISIGVCKTADGVQVQFMIEQQPHFLAILS